MAYAERRAHSTRSHPATQLALLWTPYPRASPIGPLPAPFSAPYRLYCPKAVPHHGQRPQLPAALEALHKLLVGHLQGALRYKPGGAGGTAASSARATHVRAPVLYCHPASPVASGPAGDALPPPPTKPFLLHIPPGHKCSGP